MTTINLPKGLLPKEEFKSLSAKEKGEFLSNLLKNLLEINPEGITTSQVREATGLTYSTIWHHLEILNSTGQCYKVSRGNMDIYHSSGSITHLNEYGKGKVKYAIGIVENSQGKFVCIHEKRESRTGSQAVCSGITIPIGLIGSFIETLNKAKGSRVDDAKEQ